MKKLQKLRKTEGKLKKKISKVFFKIKTPRVSVVIIFGLETFFEQKAVEVLNGKMDAFQKFFCP